MMPDTTAPPVEDVTLPRTESYEGTLHFDTLLTTVMNAHSVRLQRGIHLAEYWCYTDATLTCRIQVRCSWENADQKLGMLAFSLLPIPAMSPQEIVWIADVNLADVRGTNTGEISSTDALLIVSYRADGVYPVVFPYYNDLHGLLSYEEPLFHGVEIPDGFVHLGLSSMFRDIEETERTQLFQGRHVAAAIASAWKHEVEFPTEEVPETKALEPLREAKEE